MTSRERRTDKTAAAAHEPRRMEFGRAVLAGDSERFPRADLRQPLPGISPASPGGSIRIRGGQIREIGTTAVGPELPPDAERNPGGQGLHGV